MFCEELRNSQEDMSFEIRTQCFKRTPFLNFSSLSSAFAFADFGRILFIHKVLDDVV